MATQELQPHTTEHYQAAVGIHLETLYMGKRQIGLKRLIFHIAVILWSTSWLNTDSAMGASKLTAIANSTLQTSSGKYLLAPVSTFGASNPQSALTLTMSAKNDYFYLKNFGNFTLRYFSMSQTLASTTIRYCINQNFKGGSYTKCADNSNAITVGTALNLGRLQFNTPLTPSGSYHFSAVSTNTGNDVISVSVSLNDLLSPGGTVYNS